MVIGIIKETKKPVDRRAPLTPDQVKELSDRFPEHRFVVEKYSDRGFHDREYSERGIDIVEDMSYCDLLVGIKEVSVHHLLPEKMYLFFSHTAKKQPHNRDMFRRLASNKNTLIDFEYLTDNSGNRLTAFGRWAGIVGAYNALRAIHITYNHHDITPAFELGSYEKIASELKKLQLPPLKLLISGEGRVGGGAAEVLTIAGIAKVSEQDFLNRAFSYPVFTQTGPQSYMKHKNGKIFNFSDFIHHPGNYFSDFLKYTSVTDVYLACHFWDPATGTFFRKEDMLRDDFNIKIVADISCDVNGPIPSTIRASEMNSPFYGYDPSSGNECKPFDNKQKKVTVMAVDNLPSELPRDATKDFGEQFKKILPEFFNASASGIVNRAAILKKGKLTANFSYLRDYLKNTD